MKWQYKVSLFFLVLSQLVFFIFAAYHTDNLIYFPEDSSVEMPTRGYSWIWYHPEHWFISLILALIAIAFFLYAAVLDLKKSERKEL